MILTLAFLFALGIAFSVGYVVGFRDGELSEAGMIERAFAGEVEAGLLSPRGVGVGGSGPPGSACRAAPARRRSTG